LPRKLVLVRLARLQTFLVATVVTHNSQHLLFLTAVVADTAVDLTLVVFLVLKVVQAVAVAELELTTAHFQNFIQGKVAVVEGIRAVLLFIQAVAVAVLVVTAQMAEQAQVARQ
jgi:hypothetical protein